MPNKQKLLAQLDPAKSVGLEIGALANPAVTKQDGEIYYLDHLSTEDLKRKYANQPGVDLSRLVDVSFIAPNGNLLAACGGKTFDYVIASHLVEHVPSMIGWLQQISGLLRLGGKLALAVPDKRFTFDRFRNLTVTGDLIQTWLDQRGTPSPKQIFDHCANVAVIDARQVWDGGGPESPAAAPRYHTLSEALELAQRYAKDGYYDVHCSVFTPASFLDVLADLSRLRLLDFVCTDFQDTARYEIEFYVTLEKVYPGFDPRLQTESILRFRASAGDDVSPEAPAPEAAEAKGHAEELATQVKFSEDLQTQVRSLESTVQELRNSLSWKITSPLRWLGAPIMRR